MAINTSALGVYDPTQFVGPTKPTIKPINRAMPHVNTNAALAPLTSSLGSYNINPQPTTGSGTAYGQVPGTIGIPASTWQQTMAQPGMQSQFNATQGLINNQLAGQLPQEVVNQIQDRAAQFGVTSGMPGSQFQGYQGLRKLGVDILGYQQQGATNAQNLAALVKSGQIDPSLAATIAAHNADLLAAPDPAKAAAQQMANWQQQLNAMKTAYPNYGSFNLGGAGTTTGTGTTTPAGGTMTSKGTLPNQPTTPAGGTLPTTTGALSFNNKPTGTLIGGTTGGGAFPSGYNPNALGLPGGTIATGNAPTRQAQLPEDSTEWTDADWQTYFNEYAQESAPATNAPVTSDMTAEEWEQYMSDLFGDSNAQYILGDNVIPDAGNWNVVTSPLQTDTYPILNYDATNVGLDPTYNAGYNSGYDWLIDY